MRIDLKGTKREVKLFLHVLGRVPQFRVKREREVQFTDLCMCWSGEAEYQPHERIKDVCLHTSDGRDVYLPMADIMQSEVRPGVHIVSGTVLDVAGPPGLAE